MISSRLALGLLFAALAACSGPKAPDVEWVNQGGNVEKSHHSALSDINTTNVTRLGLAWRAELGTKRGMEATPVMVDGTLYLSGMAGRVYAFDAVTGKQRWGFTPTIDGRAWRAACCDAVNRGVAIAGDHLFVAALDGKLYSLDRKTGAVQWTADTIIDHDRGYSSTGAPEVAGELVLIGNGGAELDVRGYVSAYDLKTGALAWRFYTVPRDPALGPQDHPDLEKAAATWDPKSRWDIGGGGSVWDAIHYDELTGNVLIGVGNGGPWHVARRSPAGGDNLYLSSLVALDAKTGRVKWHYQETPGDSWDYTATQPMVFADLEWEGQKRPVVLHAPKNGFLYVLDRRDGKVLAAHSITYQNWANGVDLTTGRPNLTPENADYSKGPRIVYPSSAGARNWHPASFDAKSGTYFASVDDLGMLYMMTPGAKPHRKRATNIDAVPMFTSDIVGMLPSLPPPLREAIEALPEMKRVREKPFDSQLKAIDARTGKTKWSVPLEGWQDRAGVLSTDGGLVFHGNLAGQLRAFDAATGKLLHQVELGRSILAAPMTYRLGGVQYVAVATGWGGGGWGFTPAYSAAAKYGNANELMVFKLDGTKPALPALAPLPAVAAEPPAQAPGIDAARIARGRGLYFSNCGFCHSNQHRSISPDLRRLTPEKHAVFNEIVLKGLLQPNGMPSFGDLLSPLDVEDLHAYLIDLQTATRARELELQRQGKPIDTPAPTIINAL